MISAEERERICFTASKIARQAGEQIRAMTPQQRQVQFKGRRDMVTEVDKASEEIILEQLGKHFPAHHILAEESGRQSRSDSDFVWYIDPLDGTTNFVHGFPAYAVSMGLCYSGKLIVGVIYDPTRDELFTTWLDGGSFLNGKPIRVSVTPDLAESLLATGFPYINDESFHQNMKLWTSIYGQTQGLRRAGAAALDLAYVAAGRLDGFWEFSLLPWDQAAGALLVTEAGGIVTRIDGTDFKPEHTSILAANPALHVQMLESIRPHLD